MGGGVSIDLIHEWDYLTYLFGLPEQVNNMKGTYSNLEIDSDDCSIYIARSEQCLLELHLDYFGRKRVRELEIFTVRDTVVGDIENSEVRYLNSGETISFREVRNDFQIKEMLNFLDICDGFKDNENDIANAINVLKIAKGDF